MEVGSSVAIQVKDDGGSDQNRENIFGTQLRVEPTRFHVELDGSCERRRKIEDDSSVFGLSYWIDGGATY